MNSSLSHDVASIVFPALTFNQGWVEVAQSTEEFRRGSRLGIKSGAFKKLLLVDSRGNAFRVEDVRKIRTLLPRFRVGDFLEYAFGNPRWEVKFIFVPGDPPHISLEQLKLLLRDSFKKQRGFWAEMLDFDGLQSLITQHSANLRIGQHLDVARSLDTIRQIAGHTLPQVTVAQEQEHVRGVL